jgi:hypothetical protein
MEVQMTHTAVPPEYHPHENQVKVASGLNVLAGLYLMLSSLLNGVNNGNMANGVLLGIIVMILAFTRLAGKSGSWASWIDALIGVWMIFTPWVYGYAGEAWMWNAIAVGLILLFLGLWSASATATEPTIGSRHA